MSSSNCDGCIAKVVCDVMDDSDRCNEFRKKLDNIMVALNPSHNTASPKNLLTLWKWIIGKFFGRC